jgi:uncharacterized membrane protein YuzA (DUF378 family)
MAKMKWYDSLAFILLVIGGINWGLSIWDVNLVSMIFGTGLFADIIYGLVGVSAIYGVFSFFKLK